MKILKKIKKFNPRLFHHFFRDYFFVTLFSIVFVVVWPLTLLEFPEKYGQDDLRLPKGYESDKYVLDDTTDRLLTFVQLSDTHLGQKEQNKYNFEDYFSKELEYIKPKFHVLTGDITHGDNGVQHKSDWILYKEILEKYNVSKDLWFDVQGNHDVYGVLNQEDDDNYFFQYTINRDKLIDRPWAYKFSYNTTFGTYDFVALNFIHLPNPSNPFGSMGTDSVDLLEQFEKIVDSWYVNHTFIISHYPIRTNIYSHKTLQTKKSMRDILQQERVIAFLSGHIHSNENYLQKLDSKTSILQASARSVKWREYRLVSIDNDIVNFIETDQDDWPKVLPTNPKNALFISKHEPLERIRKSTHIRVLIYEHPSNSSIRSVQVEIDGKAIGYMTRPRSDSTYPLWVMPWNAHDYESEDLHDIKYIIKFTDGSKQKEKQHKFSVVGQQQYLKLSFNRDYKFRTHWDRSPRTMFWIGFVLLFSRLFLFSKILLSFCFSKTFVSNFQNDLFQVLDADQYNLFKAIILHFKITFWRHVQLSNRYWCFLCLLAVSSIALPSLIIQVADKRAWLAIWVFGCCVEGSCYQNAKTYLFGFFFIYLVYLPSLELIIDLEIANKEQSPNFMTDRYIIFRSLAHFIVFIIINIFLIHEYTRNYGPIGGLISLGHGYVSLLLLIISGYLLIKWIKKLTKKPTQTEITL
ncbi:transmembrane protein [Anaeramoeba flamelloides]|uniref:Transmembrane protein n=1 Tax=Anaeramoeba flamelloides TaxID=1746091 RepID=A0AAV7ZNW2_9EUKA|nr:transmembrane protein [Anaeramoeba flamelloides]